MHGFIEPTSHLVIKVCEKFAHLRTTRYYSAQQNVRASEALVSCTVCNAEHDGVWLRTVHGVTLHCVVIVGPRLEWVMRTVFIK